jgi:NADH:ubiquinone oxidoreductase subunit E
MRMVNYKLNATTSTLLRFYIFKRERLKDYYIKLCKSITCMAMQNKAWMTSFMFKEFLSFFKRFVLGGIS